MPEISRFYGVIIKMYIKDHVPPHFHAEYGEYEALMNINTGEILEGSLPRRALRLVQLLFDFKVLNEGKPDWKPIKPLE